MTTVAMLLGHDLVDPNLDFRVYREATSLIEAGYQVTVLCWARRADRQLPPKTTYQQIRLERVFQSLEGRLLQRILAYRRAMGQLSRLAQAGDFDVIHAHDLETLPAAVRAARGINRQRRAGAGGMNRPRQARARATLNGSHDTAPADRRPAAPAQAPASQGPGDVKARPSCKVVFDSHEDWPLMEQVQNRWMGYWMQRQQDRWMPRADAILTVSPELALRLESQLPAQARSHLAGSSVPDPSMPSPKAQARLAGSPTIEDHLGPDGPAGPQAPTGEAVGQSSPDPGSDQPSCVTVLYNSEPLPSSQVVDRTALKLELKEGELNLGYIGGLRKDIIEELIDAAAQVPDTHLLVIGGPPKGQAGYDLLIPGFQEYARQRDAKVSFTGVQPYHSMPHYYQACDIVLVGHYAPPDLRPYAVPKKLLDGMAHGKPVIAGPYQARRHIIEQHRCGLILEQVRDPATGRLVDQWAPAIQKLKEDPGLAARLGQNGQQAFRDHFCWERQAEKLVRAYRKLAPA